MPLKNLLLVTYHFPPSAASGAFRMLGFARHLPKFDWRTTVVAPPELPWEPVDRRLRNQVPPATTVHEVPYPRRAPKLLRWAAPYAVWLPRALVACRRALSRERVDAVLTSGPPHWVHLLGLYLKRCHRLPWLADFRDPWISDGPAGRLSWSERWQHCWEAQVMQHADLVLANAPRACAGYRAAYPAHADKIVTLTNGYDPEDFAALDVPGRARDIRMVHAGQLYAGRHPGPFLDALQNALCSPAAPRFRVSFLGRTSGNGIDLGAEVRQRGLESVVDWGRQVSYEECLQAMSAADLLLLLDSPGRRSGVPAKVYEYLGTGRPVLALAEQDSDTAWVLRESGVVHRVAAPTDVPRTEKALLELAREGSAVDTPGQNERFTREYLAGQLAAALENCSGSRQTSVCAGTLTGEL